MQTLNNLFRGHPNLLTAVFFVKAITFNLNKALNFRHSNLRCTTVNLSDPHYCLEEIAPHTPYFEKVVKDYDIQASPLISIECDCVLKSAVEVTVEFTIPEPTHLVILTRKAVEEEWSQLPKQMITLLDDQHVLFYTTHFSEYLIGAFRDARLRCHNFFSWVGGYWSRDIGLSDLCWLLKNNQSLEPDRLEGYFACIPPNKEIEVDPDFSQAVRSTVNFAPDYGEDTTICLHPSEDLRIMNTKTTLRYAMQLIKFHCDEYHDLKYLQWIGSA